MEYLIIAMQFILSLSILVTLHEFGHFLPAKWFGMRVEKFYLFFNPWFSIYKLKRGETEWGLGWLPLGGYVKIAGMIDESMDTEQLKQEPQDWEFRAKPAWQRLIVMLGGVTVNFLLGFFIYAMLLFFNGEEYLPVENMKNGIAVDAIGAEMGLQNGDQIIAVADKKVKKYDPGFVMKAIVIDLASEMTVKRGDETIQVKIPDSVASKLASSKRPFFSPRVPFVVAEARKDMPAAKAGIQEGDSIIACNGMEMTYFDEFQKEVSRNKEKEISITVIRKGEKEPKNFNLKTTAEGTVGLTPYDFDRFYELKTTHYSFLGAFPAGFQKGWTALVANIKALGQLVTGSGRVKASESLGGFISISKLFPSTWQWDRFWAITAFLSLLLGFMNLLPIPALDGGHAVFLLLEIVMRRPVPQKVLEYAQIVGFVLLLGLLLFANGLDILRWFRGG
jgi:regulator of sigma E protease